MPNGGTSGLAKQLLINNVLDIDNRCISYCFSLKPEELYKTSLPYMGDAPEGILKMETWHNYPDALGLSRRVLGWLRILNIVYGVGVGVMLIVSLVAPEFLFGAL